jgi:hypothetical protein
METYDELLERIGVLNEQLDDDKRSVAEKDGIILQLINAKRNLQRVKKDVV